MNTKQGYKYTELGIIPEDWDTRSISQILSVGNGRDYKNKPFGNIPVYGTGGIITYIDDYLYDGQTICIGRKGTIDKPLFYSGKIWTVDTLYYTYNFIDVDVKFIYYMLLTIDWMSLNEATGVPSLTSDRIKQIVLALPPLSEQRAIAQALTDVDNLIAALDKQISKKRLLKQGAMQQLLTGNKRLPGFTEDWKEKKLGEIVSIKKGNMLTSDKFKKGNIPVIAGGKGYAGFHNVNNRPQNTITISASGASAGYVAFHNIAIFATDCSTIEPSKIYNIQYIYYLLQYHQNDIYTLQSGGAQPHVHPSDLNEMQIFFIDNIKVQEAIATILSNMDKEIEELETRKEKYSLIKAGMMQKLLTGQIRLKTK